MSILAVALWVVGVTVNHADLGSTATGFGQLLVGVATLLTVFAAKRDGKARERKFDVKIDTAAIKADTASVKADTAATHAALAAVASTEALTSLGPANGANVQELLHEMKANADYQHGRNHDILNALAAMNMALPTLIASLNKTLAIQDRLLVKLDSM